VAPSRPGSPRAPTARPPNSTGARRSTLVHSATHLEIVRAVVVHRCATTIVDSNSMLVVPPSSRERPGDVKR